MSRTSTCSWLPRLLQSFNMYRPVVQVVQTDNLPNHIERHGRALRINPRIHTWVKPKNMSEMMHSGGPDFSPLEGFECTVGDSVVISRPTMSLNISTLLRIQNLTKSNFTVSTPSSMVRSNGTGLMLRCAAASSELSSSFLLNWESVVCGAMKLTTTPNFAKHLAKMMKGVLCPAAGKGITTTCRPMGGAITSIAGGGLSRFFHSRIGYGHTPAGDAAQTKNPTTKRFSRARKGAGLQDLHNPLHFNSSSTLVSPVNDRQHKSSPCGSSVQKCSFGKGGQFEILKIFFSSSFDFFGY